MKQIQKILVIAILIVSQLALAQKKDENIGTEVVNVVKPYTPTISDAFKVKETPTLEDEDNTKKEVIKYNIFSFPVASTFTPSKGKAAGVDKSAQEQLYHNYFTGGLGNYLTLFGELYITQDIGDNDYVAGMVKHLSSKGGVDGVDFNDSFLNSGLDITYGSKQRDYSWNADLGFQIQKYHWYGVPLDYNFSANNQDKPFIQDRIENGQAYKNFYIGGKIKFKESIFNEINVKYNHFWDNSNSAENRFVVKPSFQFDIQDTTIKTNVIVDYLGGTFEKEYTGFTSLKYGFTNLGVHPSIAMKKDEWAFNIGASIFYSIDTANSDNKLLFYPQVNASLKVVGDIMQFYAGAEGSLEQNSYADFVSENPFVSPTLNINPTDKQYELFAGLKGKLSNAISYNLKGFYTNEKYKPLFMSNIYNELELDKEAYKYGNSFQVVYDDLKTVGFFGELKADFSKNISFGINGSFNKYTTSTQAEAWNLPSIKIGSNLDVNITKKWYAGAAVFYVGERKDFQQSINYVVTPGIDTAITTYTKTQTLKGYFDANAHVGFKYSDRFTAFLRLNNIANQGYQKWLHYPVQSFQVMIGGNYKFDF